MVEVGLRERKKAQTRAHISDVATRLFTRHGFEAVSVSQIAEAAEVARPTVFAYFPRKEDLVFDRFDEVSATIGTATRSDNPVHAVLELLAADASIGSSQDDDAGQLDFWRLVSGSRVLQARAWELAWQLECELSAALRQREVREPELAAALIAGTYRTIHLQAIRRLLDGDSARRVRTERTGRLASAFQVVERSIASLDRTA